MIVSPVRAVAGAPVTVTYSPVDADGEPSTTDPGTVKVGIDRADGTVLVAAGTATVTDGVARSYTIPAAATGTLDRLTATFTQTDAAGAVLGVATVDVVGGVYLTTDELRTFEPSLFDRTKYPPANLIRARREVESMFERAIGTLSFVPRFDTVNLWHDGSALLTLPHYFVRQVRWVKYGSNLDDFTFTPFDLDAAVLDDTGIAAINGRAWPSGRITVGYEHGLDAPDSEVKRQAALAVRRQVNLHGSQVDARATSYVAADGGTVALATPGLGPWVTGVPSIDELLKSYRRRFPRVNVG